ncbi:MAG TPA: CehA/McbA family metallohydrolase [Planctomycetaceae bacterium]|nr:CehA/McbA family metallohydrolase [Planctomycetaceae bacterium]
MKFQAAVGAVGVMGLVLVVGAAVDRASESQAGTAAEVALLDEHNWDEFAPQGKEVDAIYGDIVLRNAQLTAVIAQPLETRNANMTVRSVAGALIDLTTRERPSDQLSAFYPGRRNYPFRTLLVRGEDGEPVALAQTGAHSGRAVEVQVLAVGGENRPAVAVSYQLAADAPFLAVTTRFTNTGGAPLDVLLEDDLRIDGQNEDMARAPNGTSELFWVHDRYWGQAYGIQMPGGRIQANSDARQSVLRYGQDGADTLTLAPGESREFTRRIYPGSNLLDVKAAVAKSNGGQVHPVRLTFTDGHSRPVGDALAEVRRNGETVGAARSSAEGTVETALPAGNYRLRVFALGVNAGSNGDELTLRVEDQSGSALQDRTFRLAGYRPGAVEAKVTDGRGQPIPCKVEFKSKPGTPEVNFGPPSAEFSTGNVCYAPRGEFTQPLPAGSYDVIVSHGPEFDAVFTELTVPPGRSVPLAATLVRSVETPGWVSSDFHSHSSPSGDNTGSQLGRVLNLLAEHIEFAPCTEHNRVDTYVPHIERLDAAQFIATTSGIELTGQPLPLNHQNAFPLVHRPRTQDGGGPQTDTDPERQIERLALWDDRSEKFLQQNHPDLGWLFYDRDGDGQPDGGFERSFAHIDVMEIHPIADALRLEPVAAIGQRRYGNRVFAWLQLLNQGLRIPGVVNTDAHYNYHGSGGLRNWVQSSTDDPARIDTLEMVRAAEQGRLILSNGPYLEVSLREAGGGEAVTAGQDLPAASGEVELSVRVQCANWLDVDRVRVLVNGRPHPEHDYTRATSPDRFGSGTVKFDERLRLRLDGDAHVIVIAGGEASKLGPVLGPFWGEHPPAALSNPIYVDVDGNGFQPNGDTLGHPLPVKFRD